MKEETIVEKVAALQVKIKTSVEAAILFTDKYMNSFSKEDFYTFDDNADKVKHYKKGYSDLLVLLSEPLTALGNDMSRTSSLLIEADREMNTDMIILLQAVFEEYLRFEKKLSEYDVNIKKAFDKPNVSVSTLLEETKKFKFSLLSLLNKVK